MRSGANDGRRLATGAALRMRGSFGFWACRSTWGAGAASGGASENCVCCARDCDPQHIRMQPARLLNAACYRPPDFALAWYFRVSSQKARATGESRLSFKHTSPMRLDRLGEIGRRAIPGYASGSANLARTETPFPAETSSRIDMSCSAS